VPLGDVTETLAPGEGVYEGASLVLRLPIESQASSDLGLPIGRCSLFLIRKTLKSPLLAVFGDEFGPELRHPLALWVAVAAAEVAEGVLRDLHVVGDVPECKPGACGTQCGERR